MESKNGDESLLKIHKKTYRVLPGTSPRNKTLVLSPQSQALSGESLELETPTPNTEGFVGALSKLYDPKTQKLSSGSPPIKVTKTDVQTNTQSSSTTDSSIQTTREESSNTLATHVPSRYQHSCASSLFGLTKRLHQDFHQFEKLLQSSSGFVIYTKFGAPSGQRNVQTREYCYEVKTIEDKLLGKLVPVYDVSGCSLFWRKNFVDENDPFSFALKAPSPNGETILTITGLDEESGTEDVIFITQGDFRNLLGSINFGFLGAQSDDSNSREMVTFTRDRSHMVPTSVIDMDGDLAFIFRESKGNPAETEVLTADGTATVVATMYFVSDLSPNSNANEPGTRRHFFGRAYRVQIEEGVSTLDKTLIVGIGVTMFNRWLQKKQAQQCCIIL